APTEPTDAPVLAPSEPTEEAEPIAPSEPTRDAGCIAPNEPTAAGEVDTKDCPNESSDESEAPAAVADGAGRSGAVEAEVSRHPAMTAGGGAVRLPSPFRSGGGGPKSVGLPRVCERSW